MQCAQRLTFIRMSKPWHRLICRQNHSQNISSQKLLETNKIQKKNISPLTNYSWLNKKLYISFRRWIVTKNRRIWLETTKIRCGLQARSLPVKVDLKMSHPLWHLNLSSLHWRACKDSRLFIFYRQWILFFFFLTERGQGLCRETRYPDKRLKKMLYILKGAPHSV